MGSIQLPCSLTSPAMASLSLYTQNIPLTQKAKFWTNYVSALKGNQDLRVQEGPHRTCHPSVLETLPYECGKLETQLWDWPRRRAMEPLTPVIADANDRIHSLGYSYHPVHTEIYGTHRPGGKY